MMEKYGTDREQTYCVKKPGGRMGEYELVKGGLTFDQAIELADKLDDYKIFPEG